jgi:hypothetical protein
MAAKYLPDGQDFGSHPSHFSKDFGFSGSSEPYANGATPHTSDRGKPKNAKTPPNPDRPFPTGPTHGMDSSGGDEQEASHNDMGDPAMAHGGHMHPHGHHVVRTEHRHDGARVEHHAHGGMTVHHHDGRVSHHHHDGSEAHEAHGGMESHVHPHGHHVTHVQHHADGRVVHHHSHGGHSVHHPDGRITHHHDDGSPVHMAHGGHEGYHDPESEFVHRAKGGMADEMQDKKMIKKAFREHDEHMHEGKRESIHLAQGGMPPAGGMMPRHQMPVNRPPRNPQRSVSPRNAMPGGQMGYGVEPSAEPDMAGTEQGMPQLSHGGRAKRHRE